MKFLDPLPTTCDWCSTKAPQRVVDLLALTASCPSCGKSLAEVGRQMRAKLDECGRFYTLVEITLELEITSGIMLSDAELEGVNTLRQLAAVVQRHLPCSRESEVRSLELVKAAAKKQALTKTKDILLDVPINALPESGGM